MARDSIKLRIGAEDKASAVVNKVKSSTVALGVVVGNLANKAISGLLNSIRGWIDEALEAERANVRLDAALRGVGKYSKELSKEMKDLAGSRQNEIAGSDEAYKDMISTMLTMGIATDKIGDAVRAVTALKALGYEGNSALSAVARAVEGDYKAFNRLIPAVRQARTDQEKLDAINRTIAAGYEQQKANLNSVGGAWEALKGRLGDMREALGNAILEGLGLGASFKEAQERVGEFLKSASFQRILDNLREGAEFAKQIGNALTVKGGIGIVIKGLATMLLGALKDGADYFVQKISENSILGKIASGAGEVSRAAAGMGSAGYIPLSGVEFNKPKPKEQGEHKSYLKIAAKALKEEVEQIEKRVNIGREIEKELKEYLGETKKKVEASEPVIDPPEKKLDREQLKILSEKEAQVLLAKNQREINEKITAEAKKEAEAQEKIRTAKGKLAALYKEGLAGAWQNFQEEKKANQEQQKADKALQKDIDRARAEKERLGDFGRLSKKDAELIKFADKRDKEIKKQQEAWLQAEKERKEAQKAQKEYQKMVLTEAQKQRRELEIIRKQQDRLLREGGGI